MAENRKKVLIVTYYWPPAGGPGVQRVLKFSKYLPEFGWDPIILTVKNGAYPALDSSLEKNISNNIKVFKTASLEPIHLYKRFVGMKSDEAIPNAVLAETDDLSWKKRLANAVRMNLFIPDAKIGWRSYAVSKGMQIIKKLQPDLIFSSSPPPTVHLISKELASRSKLPWVADFRDPWTDIHYYEHGHRQSRAVKKDMKLEKEVLDQADRITCISHLDVEMDFGKKAGMEKCLTIPNGYDEEDFESISYTSNTDKDHFTLLHLGAVGRERNPENLFKAIKKLSQEGIISAYKFTLRFVGKVEPLILESIQAEGIMDYVDFISYLPHHEALKKMEEASAMLLLITQSEKNVRIMPGKTFEYMRTGLPILALGPENGEVAGTLGSSKTGKVIDYNSPEKIELFLKELLSGEFKMGKGDVVRYSRRQLTKEMAACFDELTTGK